MEQLCSNPTAGAEWGCFCGAAPQPLSSVTRMLQASSLWPFSWGMCNPWPHHLLQGAAGDPGLACGRHKGWSQLGLLTLTLRHRRQGAVDRPGSLWVFSCACLSALFSSVSPCDYPPLHWHLGVAGIQHPTVCVMSWKWGRLCGMAAFEAVA